LRGFTGVDDPYEPPIAPDMVLPAADLTPAVCAAAVVESLEALGLLGRA